MNSDCRYKDICHNDCKCCDIYESEKTISNFIKAKDEFIKPITDLLTKIMNFLAKILK